MIVKEKHQIDKDERETLIRLDIDDVANVYTSDYIMLNYIIKLSEQYPDEVSLIKDDEYGSQFSLPKSWIKIKPRIKRNLSEETKEKARKRLETNRKPKKERDE